MLGILILICEVGKYCDWNNVEVVSSWEGGGGRGPDYHRGPPCHPQPEEAEEENWNLFSKPVSLPPRMKKSLKHP